MFEIRFTRTSYRTDVSYFLADLKQGSISVQMTLPVAEMVLV
jgi:hypothetical protein